MDGLDIRKLLEQEPEFAEYAKEALFQGFVKADNDFLRGLYNFYMIGSTPEQVAQFIANSMLLNSGKDSV